MATFSFNGIRLLLNETFIIYVCFFIEKRKQHIYEKKKHAKSSNSPKAKTCKLVCKQNILLSDFTRLRCLSDSQEESRWLK